MERENRPLLGEACYRLRRLRSCVGSVGAGMWSLHTSTGARLARTAAMRWPNASGTWQCRSVYTHPHMPALRGFIPARRLPM